MAEIIFKPETVEQVARRVILTDATGSILTLKLPSSNCARLVSAALLHNLEAR